MKKKISISIDKNTLDKLEAHLEEGVFRNKSHVIEFALNKFIKENENGKKE